MIEGPGVRDQMVKTAARIWGVQDHEIVNNFDPLVTLLIEACAAELEKINNEISLSHDRLLDRMINLLLPESLLLPRPSSCIMHSRPKEPTASITSNTIFHTGQVKHTFNDTEYNADYNFSPIGTFLLHKVHLKYVFLGNNIYRSNNDGTKTLIHSAKGTSSSNSIWLAFIADETIKNLDGLQLYLNPIGHSEQHRFLNSLKNAKGSLKGSSLQLKSGFYNQSQFELNAGVVLAAANNARFKIAREVAFTYSNKFISITNDIGNKVAEMPDSWKDLLPKTIVDTIQQDKLLFLKIELNEYFSQGLFDSIQIAINAFPVINLKLNAVSFRTDEWLNVVPLPVDSHFFELHKIKSTSGSAYKIVASAETKNISEGEAIIKSSGVGRTSSKEVRERINLLIDAIRDESAFFSQISNESILGRLKEISKVLYSIEENVNAAADLHQLNHYLLLRPKIFGESLDIQYWSTDGEKAHFLRSGNKMIPLQDIIDDNSCYLLTKPLGAKDSFSQAEKSQIIKFQITAKGKIVSISDLKEVCFRLFEDTLIKVDIRKTTGVSTDKEAGFFRTIDVVLTLDKSKGEIPEKTEQLVRSLEYELQENAVLGYPFRVFIE